MREAEGDTDRRAATRDRLMAGVASIADTLVAQCDGEEAQACLSPESAAALQRSGILAMKTPAVLGGAEADLVTQFEVLEALACLNPAAAWCAMVGATSLALPGAFLPDRGAAKMFGAGVPRGAILIMPSATARAVAEGYRVSGRWAFASGVQYADWITAVALVTGDGGAPAVPHMLVFAAGEARLHDNWQVLGLRGTGSCDISIEDVFVPAEFAWNVAEQAPRRGGPLYRLGIPAFVAYEHAAFALGLTRRALDALSGLAAAHRRGYAPGTATLAARPLVQRAIGRGELALAAARALAVERNRAAMDAVERGETVSPRLALELRGVAVYCTELAREIVGEAFRHAGARAIYEGHVLQRCLRDISVAGQHLMVSESAYELLGRCCLGDGEVDPMG